MVWAIGFCASAAVISAFPATARWPLPTGLGGVMGDMLFGGARNLVGLSSSPLGGLVAFAYAAIAILAMTAATGFGLAASVDDASPTPADDSDERYESTRDGGPREDDPGFGVILLGWLAHGFMALKGAMSRRIATGMPQLRMAGVPALQNGAGTLSRARLEPTIGGSQGNLGGTAHGSAERFGTPEEEERHVAFVAEKAPGLKPGKRIQREAQPSFLDTERDRFELPALSYLAEPKKAVITISKDALDHYLEANPIHGVQRLPEQVGERIIAEVFPIVARRGDVAHCDSSFPRACASVAS